MTNAALPASDSVSVEVDATAETLWSLYSDPATWVKFSTELKEAHYVDGTTPRVGAVIEGHNQSGEYNWTTESVVTRCEPPRLLEWATGDPITPTATWTFEVTPSERGCTLTHSVLLHADVPPLGPAIAAEPDRAQEIVDKRLSRIRTNMQNNVEGIANMAQTSA